MAETEIVAARTLFSKVFDLGNGRRRLRTRTSPMHYRDDAGVLRDINLDDAAVPFELATAPYRVEGRVDVIGFRYTSRASGEVVTCRLTHIGGSPVASQPVVTTPARRGRAIVWEALPDVTIGLRLLPGGIAVVKRLASATAPKSFTWRIEQPSAMAGIRGPATIDGHDNVMRDPVAGRASRSFPLELTLDEQTLSDDGTTKVTRLTETWTGRILKAGVPATDVVYPVEFDPSFTETITTNADDGEEYNNTTWAGGGLTARTGSYYGTPSSSGFRFVVDDGSGPNSGDTIDSATITWAQQSKVGTPSLIITGDDVDNAAAWSSSSRPSQITPTTANVPFTAGASPETITITTIIQEIINRAGWVRGNSLRLAVKDNAGSGNHFMKLKMLETAINEEADLNITYTAGGGPERRWILGPH